MQVKKDKTSMVAAAEVSKVTNPTVQSKGMYMLIIAGNLISVDSREITMSSREIAELVEKRHDNVKRTIETLLKQGVITLPQIEETSFIDKTGKIQRAKEYRLIKRDTYVVVAQLSPEFTARLVDRWQEFEKEQKIDPMIALNDPSIMRGLLLNYSEMVLSLEQQVTEMLPQTKAFKKIADADGSMCITDTAKALQIQPKRLFAYLSEQKWIYRRAGNKNWIAYQDKLQTGVLAHKITTIIQLDGSERINEQVLVTPKGIAKLAALFVEMEAVA